jgi:hypothetical protein
MSLQTTAAQTTKFDPSSPNQPTAHPLVVIDPGVADFTILAAGVLPGAKVLVLDAHHDGIQQITEYLQTLTPDSFQQEKPPTQIHILAHGSPGTLHLGNSQLSLSTLEYYAADLKTWFSGKGRRPKAEGKNPHPTPHTPYPIPTLCLYACNLTAGDAGAEFIEKLHHLTTATIAASTTKLGNGHWFLNTHTPHPTPHAYPPIYPTTLAAYPHTLANPVIDLDDDVDGNNDADYAATSLNGALIGLTDGAASVSDSDSTTLSGMQVVLFGIADGASELLTIGGTDIPLSGTPTGTVTVDAITYGYVTNNNILTFSPINGATPSAANMAALLNAIQYQNTATTPTEGARLFGVDILDESANGSNLAAATITVDINEAPINTVPAAQTVDEDTALAITGLRVADVNGNLTTTQLSVINGTLSVTLSGDTTLSAGANGSSDLTLSGSEIDINDTLATVSYQSNADFNGSDTLTMVSTDGGSPPLSDTDTVAITVNAVNDAPVNTVPVAQTIDEDTALAISGLRVTDVDGNLATTQLSVTNGTLSVTLSGGVTLSAGANGSSDLTLSGSEIDINDTLATVSYQGNADFNGSDTLTMVSTDSGSTPLSDTDTVAITVNAVNDAPTAVVLDNPTSILAENTDTTSRLKVADIVIIDDGQGSNSINLTGANATSFEVDGTELYLKAGISLDYESQTSYAVIVNVDDPTIGATPDASQPFTVTITDENEAPTAVFLKKATKTLAENTDTTNRLKVADIEIIDDVLGTNTMTLEGADAASFEVDAGALYLKAGTALDYEIQTSYAVTVEVDDPTVGTSPDVSATYRLNITDINEAPTAVTLENTTTALAENTNTSSRLKVADIAITDDALGINGITLSGTDASSFEVDDTGLYLKAGTALDYETQTSYAVTVEVDDPTVGTSPDATAPFTLTITDANEAPSAVTLSNPATTLAENTDTTSRLKVADIAIIDDALGSNTTSLTGADATRFEVDGTGLYLKADTSLDYETQTSYAVTVNVDDPTVGATPDATAPFTLGIIDANEAPTAVVLQNTVTTLAENTNTTGRLKVADIAITDDALGTNTITLTGADAANFVVDGGGLYLKAGTPLDHETKSAYVVTVNVDDPTVGVTPDATAPFTLGIIDANEAPTAVVLQNTVTTLAENTNTTGRLKVADIAITDDALGTNTITLSGADATQFEVDGTGLYLKAGTALDYESQSAYAVVVNVDDPTVGATPDVTTPFSLTITDVNEAPTAVALQNPIPTLAETADTTSRLKVADIIITDDALGTNGITLTGADAASFEVDAGALYLKAGTSLDYETQSSYAVIVSVDDPTVGNTPDLTAAFTLAITDVNEAPTAVILQNTTPTLAENTNTTNRLKVADIAITDDALGTNGISLTGADAANFEVDGTELYLVAGTALDYETQSSYAVTVEVDDPTVGNTPDVTAAFSLTVTDVNEAPTAVVLENTVTTLAENIDTTSRIKIADIAITDDALGTNGINLTGANATRFEVDGGVLYLKAGTVLDYEAQSSYAVIVNVDDPTVGATPDVSQPFTLMVTDVNEAPTAVFLKKTIPTLAENTDTTSRIRVADIEIIDDALGTNTITLEGADAASFEVDGGALYLKAGTSLDFETQSAYAVTVEVDDPAVGNSPDVTAPFTLAVVDVNEAPTAVVLENTTPTLAENTDTTSRLKVADIVITDDALGTNGTRLTGADAASFEVDGGALYLKAGTSLDFETQSAYAVTVEVDDPAVGNSPDVTAPFTLAVVDVNEAPTAVVLENTVTTLAENTDTTSRLKVADIVITDDALGTNGIRLTGADAASFEVDGGALYLKAGTSLDFETQSAYAVTVEVDDPTVGNSPDLTAAFSLTVTDVNEAPTAVVLENTPPTLAENTDTTSRLKVADIAITDDALGINGINLTGADAASFEVDGTGLYLKAGIALDFETQSAYAVTVEVDDPTVGNSPDLTAAFSLTVTDVNEAPTAVVLENTPPTLAENTDTTSRLKVADIAITDDALGINGINLTGADAASFEVDGTGLYLKAGIALDFETQASYAVTVEVDDPTVGNSPDLTAAFSLTIADVNEVPTSANASVTLNEDSFYAFSISDFVFSDPEGTSLAALRISILPTGGDFFLDVDGSGALDGSETPIIVNQVISVTNLGQLVFRPVADANGNDYASFGFQVGDGANFSSIYTMAMNITAINDAPSFIASNPPAAGEDSGLVTLTNWASFNPGAANESGQTATYTVSNVTNSALFAVAPTIDANGTLTYTPADNQFGTSNFTVQVQDSGGTNNGGVDTSVEQTFTLTVNSVNDAPSFSEDAVALSFNAAPHTGRTLYQPTATDIDGDTLTYSLVAGNEDGRFSIDPATGLIKVVDDTLWGDISATSPAQVPVTMQVRDRADSTGLTDTLPLTLNISGPLSNTDFNQDGMSDILWRNADLGKTSVWYLQDGTPTTGTPITPSVPGANYIIAGIGDLDADGKEDDIVWRETTQGRTIFWYMEYVNGTPQLVDGGPLALEPGFTWALEGVGDFDGDGYQDDLMWSDPVGELASIWYTNDRQVVGGGPIQATQELESGWGVAAVGNFDNDGLTDDLVWRNSQSGEAMIWLMEGTNRLSATDLPTIDTRWELVGAADYDGDYIDNDLIWHNTLNGSISIWSMNGTAVANSRTNVMTAPTGFEPVV